MKNIFNIQNLYKLGYIFIIGLILRLLINNINSIFIFISLIFTYDNTFNYMLLIDIKEEFFINHFVDQFSEIPNIFNADNKEENIQEDKSELKTPKNFTAEEYLFNHGYIKEGNK
jgi:hypothetical protein